MSDDPISKSQLGPGLGKTTVISKQKGRGSIYTDRDYSRALKTSWSRIIFVALCLIPYIAICVVLYLDGVEILGITLLAIPFVLFFVFRSLAKNLR
ncbi:MAG: hypothetical protein AB8B99_18235 [Phormidesmis sp.]